jgi:hypothetical protein
MDKEIKLPFRFNDKVTYFIIDKDLVVLQSYRLKASANTDLHNLEEIYRDNLKIVTKEEYEKLKQSSESVTTK